MTWLASGIFFGTLISLPTTKSQKFLSWFFHVRLSDTHFVITMVLLTVLSAVPAIGGFVTVGHMLKNSEHAFVFLDRRARIEVLDLML